MSSILDLPEVRERVSRISVADYHKMDEFTDNGKRTELIRGIVIEKMSKSSLHSWLNSRLFSLIFRQLPEGLIVRKEEPLTLKDSEPEPDVSVVVGHEDDYARAQPTTASLVIEVAVSSVNLDRANAPLYAEANVQEYWIVLAREQRIEVYRQPTDGQYEQKLVFSRDQCLTCESVPSITVDLAMLFAMPPAK